MKQLLTTCILVILVLPIYARLSADRKSTPSKEGIHPSEPKFEIKGDSIVFSGLSKRMSDVYIMNKNGSVELSGTINKKHNTMDLTKLPKGDHVIALKQGEKIKVFGYLEEVVIN